MIQKSSQHKTNSQPTWITKPHPGHLVQFYDSEAELLAPLCEYVSKGLEAGETCIMIATQPHIMALHEMPGNNGTAYSQTGSAANFLSFDAEELLSKFMVHNMPDWNRFMDTVGLLVQNASALGRPIRAYGEMVAILWKNGRKEAVSQLEEYWNELARSQKFSLYCAYPKLQFIYDPENMKQIERQHELQLTAGSVE